MKIPIDLIQQALPDRYQLEKELAENPIDKLGLLKTNKTIALLS